MLGDAACLLVDHIGLSDGVQQGGLAVVHVAHDTDHRRPLHQSGLILLALLQQLLDHVDLDLPLAENLIFHSDILRFLVGDLLIHGNDLSFQEKLLHDGCRLQLHLVRQILDGDHVGKGDHFDDFCGFLFLLFRPDEPARLVLQRLVFFINMILFGALTLLQGVCPPLFFLPLLLHILCRSLSAEAFRGFIISESGSLPSIASAVARTAIEITVAARAAARTTAITLTAFIARPAASLISVLAIARRPAALTAAASGLELSPIRPSVGASARALSSAVPIAVVLAPAVLIPASLPLIPAVSVRPVLTAA